MPPKSSKLPFAKHITVNTKNNNSNKISFFILTPFNLIINLSN